ncbi:hypothetical protein HDU78_004486 [Chytriomyces hyalinus]|nr:hypothetical protein HDU78_004486 [Chytriomyces hyalinus]
MKIIHVLLTATLGSTAFAQSIQQLFTDPTCTGPVVHARSVDSTGCAPLNCVNSGGGLYVSQMCALNDPLQTARTAFPANTEILEEYIYSDAVCSAGGSFSLWALSVCIPDEDGSGVYFKFENMKATVDRNVYSDSSCTTKINSMSGYQLVGPCINLGNSTVQGPNLGSPGIFDYRINDYNNRTWVSNIGTIQHNYNRVNYNYRAWIPNIGTIQHNDNNYNYGTWISDIGTLQHNNFNNNYNNYNSE